MHKKLKPKKENRKIIFFLIFNFFKNSFVVAFERLPLSFKSLINIYFDDIYIFIFFVFFFLLKVSSHIFFLVFFLIYFCVFWVIFFVEKEFLLQFKNLILYIFYVFVLRFYSQNFLAVFSTGKWNNMWKCGICINVQREDDCQLCFVTGYYSALSTKCIWCARLIMF